MAGRGSRLGLAISKDLPWLPSISSAQRTVLSEVMLRRMLVAGMREAVLSIAGTKLDIRDHFGDVYRGHFAVKHTAAVKLNYVLVNDSPNTPTSIDAAYQLTRGRICALGFADILYSPCPGYARALNVLARGDADVVLGLFPTNQASSSDMVAFGADGRVTDILIKQVAGERLAYTWSLAVWRPEFTDYMHGWLVADPRRSRTCTDSSERYVGDVLLAAMGDGLRVDAVVVSARASLDAGTPQSLERARQTAW